MLDLSITCSEASYYGDLPALWSQTPLREARAELFFMTLGPQSLLFHRWRYCEENKGAAVVYLPPQVDSVPGNQWAGWPAWLSVWEEPESCSVPPSWTWGNATRPPPPQKSSVRLELLPGGMLQWWPAHNPTLSPCCYWCPWRTQTHRC